MDILSTTLASMGTSDVIALSSVFIAMLALGVSVWTIVADQRHSRLSVRPKLAIHRYFDQSDWCGLYMSNLGLGPAIVRSFELKIDGELTPTWNHALTQLGFGDEMGDLMTRTFKADDAIADKDTGPLIRLAGGAKDYGARREKLQSALKRLSIGVSYESMYRESHVLAWP